MNRMTFGGDLAMAVYSWRLSQKRLDKNPKAKPDSIKMTYSYYQKLANYAQFEAEILLGPMKSKRVQTYGVRDWESRAL